MQFGSIINTAIANSGPTVPEVGMGVTLLSWSDRHPGTIVEVRSPSTIVVQCDKYRRTDTNGLSESQTYEFERDEDGEKDVYTLRKNGCWVRRGEGMRTGQVARIGKRGRYYDFSH